jgi:hypothetical protein
MTTYPDIEEYQEAEDQYDAKALLDQGWIHLGLKIKRSVKSDGSFEDKVGYILGKPKRKE